MASFAEEAPWSIYRRIPDTSTFADASELRFRAGVAPRIPDEGWSLPFHCRRRAGDLPRPRRTPQTAFAEDGEPGAIAGPEGTPEDICTWATGGASHIQPTSLAGTRAGFTAPVVGESNRTSSKSLSLRQVC